MYMEVQYVHFNTIDKEIQSVNKVQYNAYSWQSTQVRTNLSSPRWYEFFDHGLMIIHMFRQDIYVS